jgi:hypothetical protein
MTEIDRENIAIYIETLFTLARDAWRQGRTETFDWLVKGYLTGLVPASALAAFVADMDPNHGTNVRARVLPHDGNGGTLVTNPVPPPRLPPAPSRLDLDAPFRVAESSSLKW